MFMSHYATEVCKCPKFFHMNWGWGGSYDGWFYNGDWTPGTNDFTNDKYMIHR